MASERFPKAKYVRQLHRMIAELAQWRAQYTFAAAETDNAFLEGAFSGRAAVIDDAAWKLWAAIEALEGTPRIR